MSNFDIFNQIEKLSELRKNGAISEVEFSIQKKKLLSMLDLNNTDNQPSPEFKRSLPSAKKNTPLSTIFIVIAVIIFIFIIVIPFIIVMLTWMPDWISPEGTQ